MSLGGYGATGGPSQHRLLCLEAQAREAVIADNASILLLIPFEIRLQIYHCLLKSAILCVRTEADASTHVLSGPIHVRSVYEHSNVGSFLQTCRQICEEALQLFYELVELVIFDLRTGSKDQCFANFPTVRLVNPLIPWEDLDRARLSRVHRLIIDKGSVYWGNLGIEYSRPLNQVTLAHHGADNVIYSYMARLWVNKMTAALTDMRHFAERRGTPDTQDLSITMNFSILVDPVWLRQVRTTDPTYFSLTLTSEERFILEYKHEDQKYVVVQKRV